MVSTTTRVAASAGSAAIRRVASRPSMPGIRMSISTTSGRRSRDQVDRLLRRRPPRRRTVDVGLGVEQRAEPGPQQRLVVGEHHPDHGATAVGKLATTRSPPSGDGSSRTSPPSAAARSRMPRMPLPSASAPDVTDAAAVVVDA